MAHTPQTGLGKLCIRILLRLHLTFLFCALFTACEQQDTAPPTPKQSPPPAAEPSKPVPVKTTKAPAPLPAVEEPQITIPEVNKEAPKKDGYQTLKDNNGRMIEARILHVEGGKAYIRRLEGADFEMDTSLLNKSSKALVDSWAMHYAQSTSDTQLAYLRSLGEPVKQRSAGTSNSASNTYSATTSGKAPMPYLRNPDPRAKWKLVDEFSDEFNHDTINEAKWFYKMKPWGERAWSPDNLWQKDGKLFIQARYEPHTDRKGNNYFYKLGIIQSRKKTTYGYFEARIKGCSKFPGLCPAFWLYSNGKETNPDYPHITYSEIDIVELQQGGYDKELKGPTGINRIDMNLHTREIIDGVETWRRPQQWPEVCKNHIDADWDPSEDFHLYACENSPEKITWYVDGIKVAESPNHNWHLPMNLTLTMELRPPLIAWAGTDGRAPVPEKSTPEGFPTHMEVDYVRSWVRVE